jgi:predicted Rossmann-fold nucleotide-binding protein
MREEATDRTAFFALPGGVGTLDEIFEVLALFQLRRVGSKHPVPFALMNYDGCFDSLIAFLEKDMVAYGSLREDELVPHWRACATNEEAMAYLNEFYGAE